ncbi:MAG: polysaccharide biosynthesis tyrosine autokinase [Armatimonadota bacterium]|nr:polysaccharide biosynthesis tyrosine autokinase [Armatimonadota bacterium]MDR7454574.1 polysaccharide biosynthesis tyrosine autokinase [Armatimonadota bacterium]MDR7495807.1 polysaccharide biosynthesis tyrosine autokinase [Armatimonadota bacterium]
MGSERTDVERPGGLLPPEPQAEPGLREHLDALRRRWWLLAITTAVAFLVALGLSLGMAPVYRGQATVVVDRSGSSFAMTADLTGISQQAFVDTLAELVKSRAVAEQALLRLGVSEEARPAALRALQTSLRVRRVRNVDLIVIEAEGATPQDAALYTNAVAEAMLDWHVESRRKQASAGRQFIEGQVETVSRELRAAEDTLARYKVGAGQVSLSEQSTLAVTKLAEFEAQRRAVATERRGVEASLREARAALARQAPTVPASFVEGEDPVVAQVRGDLARLELELVGLRRQFTDRHPQVLATRARIEEAKTRLRRQAGRTLLSQEFAANPLRSDLAGQIIKLEVERQALQAREAALAAVVGQYVRDVRDLPPREVALARLTRDLKVAEETYLLLSQKLQEARIAESSVVGDLRVVDRAEPPEVPVRPRPLRNMLFGALLGLVVGLGGAYLAEALDDTFRTPEEAAQVLGLPLLAAIPRTNPPSVEASGNGAGRGRRNGRRARGGSSAATIPLMSAEHRRSPFAEAFRHLRTNLVYLSPDRPLRTVLVTSTGPEEGKSTVAANLAAALALGGRRVWMVEADLRKPGMSWAFQPLGTRGLSDVLIEGVEPAGALAPTQIENLSFLPAGTLPPDPAELLGSQRMRAFLAAARERADAVVLDAPPVLPVSDAVALAPHVDGVLLVVHLARTPRDAARRVAAQLRAVGARVAGVVVTNVPANGRGYYYYRYYPYAREEAAAGADR